MKSRAMVTVIRSPHPASMSFNRRTNNSQAHPQPFGFRAVEWLEYSFFFACIIFFVFFVHVIYFFALNRMLLNPKERYDEAKSLWCPSMPLIQAYRYRIVLISLAKSGLGKLNESLAQIIGCPGN